MKRYLSYALILLIIPLVVIGGMLLFDETQIAWVSICVAVLSCVPFFIRFERNGHDSKRIVLIAATVALSVVGRAAFAPIPGFKPVTAFVVLCAIYFGAESGFMTGALAALVSNFIFGQGPWTPFQMLAWGIVGFIAGLMPNVLRKNRIALALYGILSGALFSLLMDLWSVLWSDGGFNLSRYIALTVTALPFTAIYAASNVVFLLLLSSPIGRIFNRIKIKYGL